LSNKFTPNNYVEHDDCIELFMLDKHGNIKGSTFFSKEHKELVLSYRWYMHTDRTSYTYYARGGKGKEKILMHRLIIESKNGELSKGLTVDHKDKNGLNNIDFNLKISTDSEQQHNKGIFKNNTSGIKGVSYCKTKGKWVSQININKKIKRKSFEDKDEAIAQRKEWEKEIKGVVC